MNLTYELSEIDSVAMQLLSKTNSKTIAFYGDMGAGKTTLIKALVKALGATDVASSPTFSLVNEYQGSSEIIYHFDFYRIDDEAEAFDMGIEDYLNSGNWNLIEWPEKIKNILDENVQKVELSTPNRNSRMLKFC